MLVKQYPFRHIVTDNLWDPVQSEPALVGAASGAFRSPTLAPLVNSEAFLAADQAMRRHPYGLPHGRGSQASER